MKRQVPKTAVGFAMRWLDKRNLMRKKQINNAYSWRTHVQSHLDAGATKMQVCFRHHSGWTPWRDVEEYL